MKINLYTGENLRAYGKKYTGRIEAPLFISSSRHFIELLQQGKHHDGTDETKSY